MSEKASLLPLIGADIADERKFPSRMDDSQSGSILGFHSLPKSLHYIVADYISNDKRNRTKRALLGKPHVTLCLSQHPDLKLGSCWHFGCLSPEDQWETSMAVQVDKEYQIKDYQSCLEFLESENSSLCPFTVEVLVFQLDMSSKEFPSTLNDLQDALFGLGDHLKRVQHVVFAMDKNSFCCFSFKNIFGNATRQQQAVDRLIALKQIIDDLRTCWTTNQTPNTMTLLDYYILKDDKPKSDLFLSKFVISLSHKRNRDLFDAVDPTLKSSKLKWIYFFETVDEVNHIDQKIITRCHAIHLDDSTLESGQILRESLEQAFSLENSPFIERIMINSDVYGLALQLPRTQVPLTNTTPRSALIELSLKCDFHTCDLRQLNDGYFQHLTHLSVFCGSITGHLNSQSVPGLKTLRIELVASSFSDESQASSLAREHAQSLIDSGRPWQLVASEDQEEWSLASYDEVTTNPQEEVKNDSLHSLPIIRELMLVMCRQSNADEWQSRLNGNLSHEEDEENQNGKLLLWAPERVEKIAAFCRLGETVRLEFKEEIPGRARLLSSLVCHCIDVEIDGAALPQLKTLELNHSIVMFSGSFAQLETLSIKKSKLQSYWKVDAPSLKSLICQSLKHANSLFLYASLLPQLSYLRFGTLGGNYLYCPSIAVEKGGSGLSHVKHVVFDNRMINELFFYDWQVENVSQVELYVDTMILPKYMESTEWLCETLTINVYPYEPERLRERGISVIKMPLLLPRVKTLTVTEEFCQVLLEREIPNLTDLTVQSPRMLGPTLRCPALRCIHFTAKLSDIEKEQCLNRATYEAIGAQPKWVYFHDDSEVHHMFWDVAPSATDVFSIAEPLEEEDDASVSRE